MFLESIESTSLFQFEKHVPAIKLSSEDFSFLYFSRASLAEGCSGMKYKLSIAYKIKVNNCFKGN